MAPLIISSARGQSRAPKPRPPRLLVPDDVETITFLCPCARSQCRDILANLWITYHSSPPASLQKQATKKEIFVLTRRLCTNVVPEGIDNHKGTSWEPCQADATGLITRDIAQISIGEVCMSMPVSSRARTDHSSFPDIPHSCTSHLPRSSPPAQSTVQMPPLSWPGQTPTSKAARRTSQQNLPPRPRVRKAN